MNDFLIGCAFGLIIGVLTTTLVWTSGIYIPYYNWLKDKYGKDTKGED